ncbi:troponin C-like, partial [Culicoides brevitarsis]
AKDLTDDLRAVLQRAFGMFEEDGYIDTDKVSVILKTLGHAYDKHELAKAIKEEDEDDSEQLDFDQFCRVICIFIHDVDEEVDDEVLQQELKEAFRLYDKQGNGYIPTSSLKEILGALDDQLTSDQLDEMITEIDTDGSGTVDFD